MAQAQEALIAAERAFGSAQADALKYLGEAYEAVRKAQINLDNYDVPSYLEGGTPAEGVEKMYAELEKAREAYEPYKYRGQNDKTRKEQKKRLDDAWDRFNTCHPLGQAGSRAGSRPSLSWITPRGSLPRRLADRSKVPGEGQLLDRTGQSAGRTGRARQRGTSGAFRRGGGSAECEGGRLDQRRADRGDGRRFLQLAGQDHRPDRDRCG